MAPPDVNSVASCTSRYSSNSNTNPNVPTSQPPNQDQSRRTSTMGPPPVPNNSSLPNSPRPPHAVTSAPTLEREPSNGPLRHPRPLTAAELHLELEKEQESIVNRLTRELSALRAQTASVASTTSSTSDLFTSQPHNLPEYPSYGTGANIIPTSARRHRSSSNLSTRSARSARDGIAASATSVSAVAAPRDSERASARQSLDIQRPDTSRQNSYSLAGPGLSTSTSTGNISAGAGMYRTPSYSSVHSPHAAPPGHGGTGHYPHRTSRAASHSQELSAGQNQGLGIAAEARSPSFSSAQAAARYEEAAVQRQELEAVKKENEVLKQRIRDLERAIAAVSG